jgi:hypothetical protein
MLSEKSRSEKKWKKSREKMTVKALKVWKTQETTANKREKAVQAAQINESETP